MRRIYNFKQLLFLLLSVILVACSTEEDEREFRLQGVWELQRVTVFDEEVLNYPENGMTRMRIYDDSCYYECQVETAPTGTMITPTGLDVYTYVDKGQGNILYLQGENTQPLSVLNDSTIVIQEYGRKYTWKLNKELEAERRKDIVNIIRDDMEDNGNVAHHYVFSKAEKELEADKHLLIYIIIGVALLFLVFIYHFYLVRKEKKRVERELLRIEQERQAMPEPVRQAMTTVTDEFHKSDFYLSLRKRIANDERLTKEDWDAIETQFQSVYPRFTSTLLSLHNMSQLEYQVCLLLKLNVAPSEIANVLCKDKSSISTIRSRLYAKVFGKKGSSRDWDEFVKSL